MAVALSFLVLLTGQLRLEEPPLIQEDKAWLVEAEAVLAAPVDVNSAGLEDLLAIPWLSPRVAAAIVHARDSLGGFSSYAQLAAVPGVDATVLAALRVNSPERRARTSAALLATARSESLPGPARAVGATWRLKAGGANWAVAANVEKDDGEADWADFAGAGAEYRFHHARFVAGDFTLASGLGLVLSAPGGRSGYSTLRGEGDDVLRLAGSVDESRYMRGGAVEAVAGRVRVAAGLSAARRDARLDELGAVTSFSSGGLHDDSAALARKGRVAEWTGGAAARLVLAGWDCGVCLTGTRYDRAVAPADSTYSFYGQDLVAGGVSAGLTQGPYRLTAEVAASAPGGLAAAGAIDGRWSDLDVGASCRWRSDRYFAPHGRWTGLTARKQRVDASGRLRYRFAPVAVGVSGSTYRDLEEESLPGRLEAVLEQQAGRLQTELRVGQRYRGSLSTLTTGRLTAVVTLGGEWATQAVVAYEAEPATGNSGMVAALRVWGRAGPVRVGLGAGRFRIPHGDVRMNLYEPGPGRLGHSFSTDTSCWRLAATAGVTFGVGRVAIGLARTMAAPNGPEVAAQVEIGLPRG